MTHSQPSMTTMARISHVLLTHRRRWLVPAAIGVGLAAVYAIAASRPYEASQMLIIRDEAVEASDVASGLAGAEEMKVTQETILALAKSPEVVGRALLDVGPPAGRRGRSAWPSEDEIEQVARDLELKAPHGTEFGRTEIFNLVVRDASRQRAGELAAALATRLQQRHQAVLDLRAASMVQEVQQSVDLAREQLTTATDRIAEVEQQIGGDLAELRSLKGGTSQLNQDLARLDDELRQSAEHQQALDELTRLLESAQHDQGHLLATPNRLLESQPGLRRLKEALLDAQVRTAQLLGRMTAQHPTVKAARHAEAEISARIERELSLALSGLALDRRLTIQQQQTLSAQREELKRRLGRIAGMRAHYANLVADVDLRAQQVQQAESRLSAAHASRLGAGATSLLARVDGPVTSSRPVGPGATLVLLAGLVGGLAVGLSIVYLTVPDAEFASQRVRAAVRVEQQAKAQSWDGSVSLRKALHRAGLAEA